MNIQKSMEIIRTELSGWMIDHEVSYGDAENAFAKIENALEAARAAERYKRESINGFHAGERVRITKHLTTTGAGGHFIDLPEDRQKTGTLRNNPNGQTDFDISDFFVDFEDGTHEKVLTAEIEHA